jgi:hypothetical protein
MGQQAHADSRLPGFFPNEVRVGPFREKVASDATSESAVTRLELRDDGSLVVVSTSNVVLWP